MAAHVQRARRSRRLVALIARCAILALGSGSASQPFLTSQLKLKNNQRYKSRQKSLLPAVGNESDLCLSMLMFAVGRRCGERAPTGAHFLTKCPSFHVVTSVYFCFVFPPSAPRGTADTDCCQVHCDPHCILLLRSRTSYRSRIRCSTGRTSTGRACN